jgi:hypothetical protein
MASKQTTERYSSWMNVDCKWTENRIESSLLKAVEISTSKLRGGKVKLLHSLPVVMHRTLSCHLTEFSEERARTVKSRMQCNLVPKWRWMKPLRTWQWSCLRTG